LKNQSFSALELPCFFRKYLYGSFVFIEQEYSFVPTSIGVVGKGFLEELVFAAQNISSPILKFAPFHPE
jgi:hypothetical protein